MKLFRVPKSQGFEGVIHIDPDKGEIGLGITADNLGLESPVVFQCNLDVLRIFHHVLIAEYKALSIDDESGTKAFLLELLRHPELKKFLKEVLHGALLSD